MKVSIAAALTIFVCQLLYGAEPAPEGAPALPAKRVEVDKTQQIMRAYEGDRVILETRVSTGREGAPPRGRYYAGEKSRMHYSRLFHDAPMPFSVQLSGNFFIHGFSSVPDYPASHGCVRVPLDGDNPAKQFFEWVEPGVPIDVVGQWEGRSASKKRSNR
jgi:lipoprotein-anchoring transpeptidase ErfK/SrfK